MTPSPSPGRLESGARPVSGANPLPPEGHYRGFAEREDGHRVAISFTVAHLRHITHFKFGAHQVFTTIVTTQGKFHWTNERPGRVQHNPITVRGHFEGPGRFEGHYHEVMLGELAHDVRWTAHLNHSAE